MAKCNRDQGSVQDMRAAHHQEHNINNVNNEYINSRSTAKLRMTDIWNDFRMKNKYNVNEKHRKQESEHTVHSRAQQHIDSNPNSQEMG